MGTRWRKLLVGRRRGDSTYSDYKAVSTPVRRCVGAVVRMHKGNDGRVHQLCGPGITILQGRAKKIHVPSISPSKALRKAIPTVSACPFLSGDRMKRP